MKKVLKVINYLLLFLALVMFFSGIWATNTFAFTSFDEVLYTLTHTFHNAGQNLVSSYFIRNVGIPLLIIAILITLTTIINRWRKNAETIFIFKFRNKNILSISLFHNKLLTLLKIIPILAFIFSFLFLGNKLYFFEYLKYQNTISDFIEAHYEDPLNVEISFPTKKKNLIYIFMESMESTYSSQSNGGGYNTNYIPELTAIAKRYTNFSANDKIGGAYDASLTGFTMAGMLAQTSGIPLKTPFNGNFAYQYYNTYFPGVYSLGDILQNQGYNQYLMVGSDAEFAGREKYFTDHGNYTIYDYNTAKQDGIIPEDYFVFWGMEDEYLYQYAKQELSEISKQKEPFNFTMLTVDTHAPDGFLSEFCTIDEDDLYLSSVRCASKQLASFLEWIQQQDFYKDTTIVIAGDHISMNTYSFDALEENYTRSIYNVFINSSATTKCNKNRIFNTMDLFPTTLAALGAKIEKEHLGLGTNLYSCVPTLFETYGMSTVNEELSKSSQFYNNCLLNGSCH